MQPEISKTNYLALAKVEPRPGNLSRYSKPCTNCH